MGLLYATVVQPSVSYTHSLKELAQFEETNNITPQELEIIKKLKKVLKYFENFKIVPSGLDDPSKVICLRKCFGIANLTTIPRIQTQACYRTAKAKNIDVYVMFAWHKLCDYVAATNPSDSSLDTSLLKKSVQAIKALMINDDPKVFMPRLRGILEKCGISFCVVPHITGAPVQGFIRELSNGSINLCMTIRQKRADIFWFTLFHEIAHILNEDFDDQFTDFDSDMEVNDIEDIANIFTTTRFFISYYSEICKLQQSTIVYCYWKVAKRRNYTVVAF